MKQFIKIYFILCLASILLPACDDYLDIVPKGSKVLETVEDYSLLLDNETMLDYNHGDIKFLVDDEWMNPVVVINAGSVQNLSTYKFLGVDPSTFNRLDLHTTGSGNYSFAYARIQKISNIILTKIDDAKGDGQLREQTKAEAKALRAYNYFVLISMYGKIYDPVKSLTEPGIPFYTEFNLDKYPKQATVAEVYDLIESDLNSAIPLLSNQPRTAYRFSKAAGYALKAKVHLFKKEFDKAKEAALESYKLNNFVFDLVAYQAAGMNYVVNSTNKEFLYYARPQSAPQMSAISRDLYLKFDTVNDIRYTGFLSFKTSAVGAPASTTYTQGDALFVPAWDENNLAGAKNYRYNLYGLRTTDVMLMLAECYAREGDYTNMKKYLDEVRKKKIKNYTTASENPANKVDAVKIVIEERRKELMFGYNRYWDLKRLNSEPEFKANLVKVIPVNPNNSRLAQATYTITPESNIWVVPLPFNEFGIYPGLVYNIPN